jgi:hypothetical protein
MAERTNALSSHEEVGGLSGFLGPFYEAIDPADEGQVLLTYQKVPPLTPATRD